MTERLRELWAESRALLVGYGFNVIAALAIAFIGWMLAMWAARAARRFAERSESLGATLAPLVGKTARIGVLVIAVVMALERFGVDTSSLLAAVGAFALAVGLALRDTVADMAAGIVILVLRPFEVGDEVDVEGTTGVVDGIDVFELRLTSSDGVPLVLPNRKVRAARILNYSRAQKRRIDLSLSIGHTIDLDAACKRVATLLAQDERVLASPPPLVNTREQADTGVTLLVRAWIEPSSWFATRLDLVRKLKLAFEPDAVETAPARKVVQIKCEAPA
jgi:small conductance mechanosensitive channel